MLFLVFCGLALLVFADASKSHLRMKGGSSPAVWPGDDSVVPVDPTDYFSENMSGLFYYPDPISPSLYAVQNSPPMLHRLKFNGRDKWLRDQSDGWSHGKSLFYPSGSGSPDAEDLTKAELNSAAMYVCSERDGKGAERLSVLMYVDDETTAGDDYLIAVKEWVLNDFFQNIPDSNLGFEGITWVPDDFLVEKGFLDANTNALYNPDNYPSHGSGLFFLGLELDGSITVFALNHDDTSKATRIASFPSASSSVMSLYFDRSSGYLWSVCDDSCLVPNEHNVHELLDGVFTSKTSPHYEPPKQLQGLNVEGFAITTDGECNEEGEKSVFWVDDGREVAGHAVYQGAIKCGQFL